MTETFKITPIENSVKVDITWDDSSYPTGSAVAAYVDKESDNNLMANDAYVWGKAEETQWHRQPKNCKIDGPAITFAIKNGTIGNTNSIWVNG